MRQSIFQELWNKMFHSGSRLNLFIGINIIVFLIIGLLSLEKLFTGYPSIAEWIQTQLSVPADLHTLLYRPWSVFTYMFAHAGFLHFLFNMLALFWFGNIFEDFLNGKQFTFVYMAGGLTGALLFVLLFNTIPLLALQKDGGDLIGASGSVMAIVAATATLLPDYSLRLLLFGDVKLKYLALAYFILDVIGLAGLNAGGSVAHIGGAVLGFIFIKQLQAGNDWSKIFQKRSKLKVVRNKSAPLSSTRTTKLPEQELIDQILDKISKSGYNSLTKEEKDQLFKASNKE